MAVQITTEQAYAYAELLEILSFMDSKFVEKIPNKLMNIFKENALPEYENHLNRNIPIEQQKIAKQTASLLVLMKLNFWSESAEEKQEIKEALNKNQKAKEEAIRKKYKTDNIFERTNDDSKNVVKLQENSNQNESNLPIDYSTLPWYKKVFNSVRNIIIKIFKK